jgi:hypothetical protein
MKRRTSIWTLRLIVASFGAALLLATGPGMGGFAYAKSDKGKKEAKAEAPKPPPKQPRAEPVAKPGASAPAARDSRSSSSSRSSVLDRARSSVGSHSSERVSTTPARPTVNQPVIRSGSGSTRGGTARPTEPRTSPPVTTRPTPPSSSSGSSSSIVLPWNRGQTPGATASPPSTEPRATEPTRSPGIVLPYGHERSHSTITRPTPDPPERTEPTRGGTQVVAPPTSRPPTTGDRAVRPALDVNIRSGSRLLRPKPETDLPREPVVVPGDQLRPVPPAPTALRRPGNDRREVIVRPFERIDQPRVDDTRRLLSPVPTRESYFQRIWTQHPPRVDRPLDISYFTALHRLQARRYYRVYYYRCAPYYYPYDYWYADYYIHYYYPCYFAQPYVVISFPILIERYHTVNCCPRDDNGVWYYYDREYDGYDAEYPYLTHYPGSLGDALRDIQRAWYREEINYLLPHLDERDTVKIYRGDRYTHDLQPSEFVDLTLDAFDQTETDYYRYAEIQRIWGGGWARVTGEHAFWDADGNKRTVYLSLLLERVSDRGGEEWMLREVRQDSQPF